MITFKQSIELTGHSVKITEVEIDCNNNYLRVTEARGIDGVFNLYWNTTITDPIQPRELKTIKIAAAYTGYDWSHIPGAKHFLGSVWVGSLMVHVFILLEVQLPEAP